jgi:hypothetical protein
MRKIVNYETVSSSTLEGLDMAVGDGIREGFEPIGGVCSPTGEYFIQALVKYKEDKDEEI